MSELALPLTGKMINALSPADKSKLREDAMKVVEAKGYRSRRIEQEFIGDTVCGFITPDPDAFMYAGLASANPVVTLTVREDMGTPSMIFSEVFQQAYGMQPQSEIELTAFMREVTQRPVTFLLNIANELPVGSQNPDVKDFAAVMKGLTGEPKCKMVVLAKDVTAVPTELARPLHNLPLPRKI